MKKPQVDIAIPYIGLAEDPMNRGWIHVEVHWGGWVMRASISNDRAILIQELQRILNESLLECAKNGKIYKLTPQSNG